MSKTDSTCSWHGSDNNHDACTHPSVHVPASVPLPNTPHTSRRRHHSVSTRECSVPAQRPALIMTEFCSCTLSWWDTSWNTSTVRNPWSGEGKENDDLSWRSFTQIRERHAVKQCVGSLGSCWMCWSMEAGWISHLSLFSAMRLTLAQSPFSPVQR